MYDPNHPYPRVHDHVSVADREEDGLCEVGMVISIDKEGEEAIVRFFGTAPKFPCDLLHMLEDPAWYKGAKDVESYALSEFEGNWRSHDEGKGYWEI